METHVPIVPKGQRSPLPFGLGACFNYLEERGYTLECVLRVGVDIANDCALIGYPKDVRDLVIEVPFRGCSGMICVAEDLCDLFGFDEVGPLFDDIARVCRERDKEQRLVRLPAIRERHPEVEEYCAALEAAGHTPK